MSVRYDSASLRHLIDVGIKEIREATDHIVKEASTYYTNVNSNNVPTVYKVNIPEIVKLAKGNTNK